MSRAPGVPGIIDIRSAAILQQHVLMTNPCAPGATRLKRNYRTNLQDIKQRKVFDSAKSWVTLIAAMLIVATVMGIFHATYLLVPIVQRKYEVGIVNVVFIYVVAYMVFIKMTTLACYCIKYIGYRLTVTFGMIVFFIGTILECFMENEPAITWFSSCIVMAIGASFAYTAAMSIVSDMFRSHLAKALAFVSLGTPLGIIIFYVSITFLLTHISYRWIKLVLGVIVLVMTGLAQTFSKARKCSQDTSHPIDSIYQGQEQRIRDCVKKGMGTDTDCPKDPCRDDGSDSDLDDQANERSCLCVCVCDVSLWSDWTFLLWAIVSMMAVIPYLVPYFFLMYYAFEIGTSVSISFICWMCVASIITRVMLMSGDDFTFVANRTTFQICLIIVGILYIGILWAETYGWILVWGIAIGAMEGAIATLIPRLTLLTTPRVWLVSSWSCILWFHALGIAIGPLLVVSIWWWTRSFTEAFITIAIIEFIAAILALLLPNEEKEFFDDKSKAVTVATVRNEGAIVAARNAVISYTSKYANSFRYGNGNDPCPCPDNGLAVPFKAKQRLPGDKNYKCCCPICKKYGCVPGCNPCTPGGLVEGGDDPCVTYSDPEYNSNPRNSSGALENANDSKFANNGASKNDDQNKMASNNTDPNKQVQNSRGLSKSLPNDTDPNNLGQNGRAISKSLPNDTYPNNPGQNSRAFSKSLPNDTYPNNPGQNSRAISKSLPNDTDPNKPVQNSRALSNSVPNSIDPNTTALNCPSIQSTSSTRPLKPGEKGKRIHPLLYDEFLDDEPENKAQSRHSV